MHFTIRAPSDGEGKRKPSFGAFFRFADQFNHYKISLNAKNQELSFTYVTFKEFKVVARHKIEAIRLDTNIRVVISFKQYIIKIWV